MRTLAILGLALLGCSSDGGNTFGDGGNKEDGGGDPLGDASLTSDSGMTTFMPGPNCATAGPHTFCDDFDGDLSKWMTSGDVTQDTAFFSSAPKSLRATNAGAVLKTFAMSTMKITVAFDLQVESAVQPAVAFPLVIDVPPRKFGVGVSLWGSNLADLTLQMFDGSWTSGSIVKATLKQWQNVTFVVDFANKVVQMNVNGNPGQYKIASAPPASFELRMGAVAYQMPAPSTTIHVDNVRVDVQ